MCLLTDSSGNPAYSIEYDFYNGKITNQWNPYNLTNLLYQHGETGAFSLPLGMSQGIIGDDYIVPLFSNNSGLGRWALGLDPGIGFHLPGDRWWVRTVSEKIYWFGRKNCRGLYRCINSRAASMFGNVAISYRVYYFFSDCPQKAPMDGLMMIVEGLYCPFCKRNKPPILERPPLDYPESEILCTLVKCECDRDLIPAPDF